MIIDQLPDIPRLLTALSEWASCLLYIVLVSRRRIRVIIVSAVLAAVAIGGWQLIAGVLPREVWVLGMLTAAGLMWLFIAFASGLPAKDSFYLMLRAFVLAELVASLHWQLHTFVYGAESTGPLRLGIAVPVTYGLAFVVAYLAERRHFSKEQPIAADGPGLILSLTIAAGTFLVSNLSFIVPNTPFSGRLGLEVFYIRTLVDLAGFIALYAQQSQRLQGRRAMELQATSLLFQAQHDQYLQSQRNIDQVNRKYHDLKHYIAAIRTETSIEKRAEFLDQLEDSIKGYEYEVRTGNPVLDAILGPKLARCKESGITVTCVVDGEALEFMDTIHLSGLFGNALDNAIEGALACPREARFIKVTAYRKHSFVLVKVENRFEGQVELKDGLPITTKPDPLSHGYGMRNMRAAAEAYGGTLQVQTDGGWFAVVVVIPVTDNHAHQSTPISV